MFHKCIFRTLSLLLLTMLFAGQASAAPGNDLNQTGKSAVSSTPPESIVYVSDLIPVSATVGWGTLMLDKGTAGGQITLKAITYTKGLGAHAVSDVVYNLNKQYSLFESQVGIDDAVAYNSCTMASVKFQVFVDGALAFDSGVMYRTSPTQGVAVDVAGANTLRLHVTDAGNGNTCDHSDWADTAPLTQG